MPTKAICHLIDRDLGVSPAFYSASFCDTQLCVNGSHTDSSRQITYCFLTRVAVEGSAHRLQTQNLIIRFMLNNDFGLIIDFPVIHIPANVYYNNRR